jgi:hypothetical protein
MTVAKTMAEQEELLQLQDAWYRLEQAQADYKKHYDRRHRAVAFNVGDWVWLRVRHRTPLSLPTATAGKLRPRYYGLRPLPCHRGDQCGGCSAGPSPSCSLP